jgi:hypothetical protein
MIGVRALMGSCLRTLQRGACTLTGQNGNEHEEAWQSVAPSTKKQRDRDREEATVAGHQSIKHKIFYYKAPD